MMNLLASVSQWEREVIGERTKDAMLGRTLIDRGSQDRHTLGACVHGAHGIPPSCSLGDEEVAHVLAFDCRRRLCTFSRMRPSGCACAQSAAGITFIHQPLQDDRSTLYGVGR
jgi:hypothetical protein